MPDVADALIYASGKLTSFALVVADADSGQRTSPSIVSVVDFARDDFKAQAAGIAGCELLLNSEAGVATCGHGLMDEISCGGRAILNA